MGKGSSASVKIGLQDETPEVAGVNDNHPVLNALDSRLQALRSSYLDQPNEQTRYQLVRQEQLIAQWVPSRRPLA
jgi:hypothetical protein